eukprot:TRINITY_DN4997_c0_g3_i1.p1 TRINITY_DN4997_c0_g3~~TRINITY_DN4997_c0_g3_i1.p1  ORF type:complete len:450 (-),score=82.41 TRINITY_DN4997_c0_g3_i1:163-1512(-)
MASQRALGIAFGLALIVSAAIAVPIQRDIHPTQGEKTLEELLSDMKEFLKMVPTPEEAAAIGEQAAENILKGLGREVDANTLNPVFLMPGFFASAMMSEFNKASVPDRRCDTKRNLHQVWVNYEDINPLFGPLECLFDTLSTIYDVNTNTYSNRQGVTVYGKDFGGLSGVEHLDTLNLIPMYGPIIKALEKAGYKRDVNIKGLPFDWMFAGHHYDRVGYFNKVTSLIEQTYAANGNRPVVIIAHSMGTLMTYHYLLGKSQEWKNRYIKSHIAITPLYLGAPLAVRVLLSGLTFLPGFEQLSRDTARGWGSIHWFVPHQGYRSVPFVSNPTRTYNSTQFDALFRDAKIPDIYTASQRASSTTARMASPGVSLHCLVARSWITPYKFQYSRNDFSDYPTMLFTDGDGLVPLESARSCTQLNPSNVLEYDTNHVTILWLSKPIEDIVKIVLS